MNERSNNFIECKTVLRQTNEAKYEHLFLFMIKMRENNSSL